MWAVPADQYQRLSPVPLVHIERTAETGQARPQRKLVKPGHEAGKLFWCLFFFFFNSFPLTWPTWPLLLTGRPLGHSQKVTTGGQDTDILPVRLAELRWDCHYSMHPLSSHRSHLSRKTIKISISKISSSLSPSPSSLHMRIAGPYSSTFLFFFSH